MTHHDSEQRRGPGGRGAIVALDGPAGSGKSTVAGALAYALGATHVDTGAFYRALTLAVRRAGAPVDDEQACVAVAERSHITRADGRTLLDGQDVEDAIRSADVDAHVSAVAAHPAVRERLVAAQRAAVGPDGAVVEGRDAGTVVVPDADLKVWLTATPAERAARRGAQLGITDPGDLAAIEADLARRDDADAAQMARATDATVVDTTGRGVDDLVADLAARARAAYARATRSEVTR